MGIHEPGGFCLHPSATCCCQSDPTGMADVVTTAPGEATLLGRTPDEGIAIGTSLDGAIYEGRASYAPGHQGFALAIGVASAMLEREGL